MQRGRHWTFLQLTGTLQYGHGSLTLTTAGVTINVLKQWNGHFLSLFNHPVYALKVHDDQGAHGDVRASLKGSSTDLLLSSVYVDARASTPTLWMRNYGKGPRTVQLIFWI
jgi:hypothetical protein